MLCDDFNYVGRYVKGDDLFWVEQLMNIEMKINFFLVIGYNRKIERQKEGIDL